MAEYEKGERGKLIGSKAKKAVHITHTPARHDPATLLLTQQDPAHASARIASSQPVAYQGDSPTPRPCRLGGRRKSRKDARRGCNGQTHLHLVTVREALRARFQPRFVPDCGKEKDEDGDDSNKDTNRLTDEHYRKDIRRTALSRTRPLCHWLHQSVHHDTTRLKHHGKVEGRIVADEKADGDGRCDYFIHAGKRSCVERLLAREAGRRTFALQKRSRE